MIVTVCDYSGQVSILEEDIKKLARHVLDTEGITLDTLNIVITNDAYMKDLNTRFLKKAKSTNVIAFAMGEMNEIYVSYEQTRNKNDLFYLIIHGLLHIIGYDHDSVQAEKKMHERCVRHLKVVFPGTSG